MVIESKTWEAGGQAADKPTIPEANLAGIGARTALHPVLADVPPLEAVTIKTQTGENQGRGPQCSAEHSMFQR